MQHEPEHHRTVTTSGPDGPTTTTFDEDWIVTLEPFGVDECWQRIGSAATVGIGRIAFSAEGVQQILPVNFACARRSIVVRTAQQSMLRRSGVGADVAFEVDHIDADRQSGWSVLIQGRLWPVEAPDDLRPDERLRLHPWAGGDRDCWIRIVPTHVSGRQVSRRRTPGGDVLPTMPPD